MGIYSKKVIEKHHTPHRDQDPQEGLSTTLPPHPHLVVLSQYLSYMPGKQGRSASGAGSRN